METDDSKLCRIPDILAPDLIIMNGTILTVDQEFSYADSVAVKEGKIVAVGSEEDILLLKGEKTGMLDLKGATMLPGINDSHMHLPWYVVSKPPYKLELGYPGVKSVADIREKVKEAANKAKPGEWIIGEGLNMGQMEEMKKDPSRKLNKEDLDDIAPDNPVYLIEFSFHNAWVNSKTLETAGIDKNSPSPEGGTIVKNPTTREPTGHMVEKARDLIEKAKPELTSQQLRQALLENAKHLSSLGITSITSGAETPEEVRLYSQIALNGDYPVRLNLMLMWAEYGLGGTLDDIKIAMKYVGMTTGFGNQWLKVGGVKIFGDGIPPSQTAWVYDAYPDGSHGGLVVPGNNDEERQKHLVDMIKFCHDMGYQIGVHACGDRAMDATVEAFVDALKENPWDARHYTLHGDWIRSQTIQAMAEWKIGHSTQSVVKYSISDEMDRIVGEERSGEQWPLRSLLDAGVMLCNSSDAPCSTPDWRLGVQSSVTRKSTSGKTSGPHQRISISEAIRSYTIIPAWLEHADHVKGSIEPGKLADFCIIRDDITKVPPDTIKDIPILMTLVGGKVVYSNNSLKSEGIGFY